MVRDTRGSHGENPDSRIVWEPHFARAGRQIDGVGKNVTRDVGLVAVWPMPMSADPCNLIPLNEPRTNLIDAADTSRRRIVVVAALNRAETQIVSCFRIRSSERKRNFEQRVGRLPIDQ